MPPLEPGVVVVGVGELVTAMSAPSEPITIRLSMAVAVMVSGGFTTAPAGATTLVMPGAVLSRVNVRVMVGAALPAWSTALTTRVWAPSVLTWPPLEKPVPSSVAVVAGGGKLSVAEKVRVTGPRTKPLIAVTVSTGGVLSIVNVRVTVAAVLPAASVAVTTRV